jgi:hypothetical protein
VPIQDGLLWFDDNPARSVGDKIERAVQRYQQKYSRMPDVCYVHPKELQESGLQQVGDTKVTPSKSVLPYHFWLGVYDVKAKSIDKPASP